MIKKLHKLETGDWESCTHNIESCDLLKKYDIESTSKREQLMKAVIRSSISYGDCRILWAEKESTKRKGNYRNGGDDAWDAYELLRRLWDNYFQYRYFPISFEDRILQNIQETVVDTDPSYKPTYPFGDVKDLYLYSHREAYSDYMEKLNRLRSNANGEPITFYFIILKQFKKAENELGVKFSRKAFDEALSLYMYRLTLGAVSEQTVINDFNKGFSGAGFSMKLAGSELEKHDIDAILIIPSGKSIAVSIKNYGALGEDTITHYRKDLNKVKPQLYFGYKSSNSKELMFLDKSSNNITAKFRAYAGC